MAKSLAHIIKQRKLENKRERSKNDLFFLARALDYNLISKEWHGPICAWKDELVDHRRVAYFAPRKSYKSRLQVVEIVQRILRNPEVTILLVHHKLEFANELVIETGDLLMKNENLRELLLPENRPNPRAKTWLKTAPTASFKLPGVGGPQHKTLKAASADQDLTGAHPDVIYLDDVISAATIKEKGGIRGIRQWVEHTIIPLLGVTGLLRVIGTMWSTDDWYHDILKDQGWVWQKRAILETDGKPDWKGKPIKILVNKRKPRFLTMEDVEEIKREAKGNFPGQYMNEPVADGMKEWDKDKEQFVDLDKVRKYIKRIALLIDPSGEGAGKDYFAIGVVGYLDKHRRVLLDGRASQDWTLDQGLRKAKYLMARWKARLAGVEEPLGAGAGAQLIGKRLQNICQRWDDDLGHIKCKPVSFKSTRKGKQPRFRDLAAINSNGDLFINNDKHMNKKFLELFLHQVRNNAGEDTLEFDDVEDAVSYMDDPAILENLHLGSPVKSPLEDETTATPHSNVIQTRYCGR
jgi:hypothetical protein